MGSFSIWHWVIVLVVVLLLFGTGKISGVMGDFAKGIKAFKKGLREEDEADASVGQQKTIDANATNTAREKDRASTV
jgi:sec-independent protein translocase protein TatA